MNEQDETEEVHAFPTLEDAVAFANEINTPHLVDHAFITQLARLNGWSAEELNQNYPMIPLVVCKGLLTRDIVIDGHGMIRCLH